VRNPPARQLQGGELDAEEDTRRDTGGHADNGQSNQDGKGAEELHGHHPLLVVPREWRGWPAVGDIGAINS
jgi:hypothetical protein